MKINAITHVHFHTQNGFQTKHQPPFWNSKIIGYHINMNEGMDT